MERAEGLEIGWVRTRKLWWLAESAYATISRINDLSIIRGIVLAWQKGITAIRKTQDKNKPIALQLPEKYIVQLLKDILPHWHTLNAQFRHETYKYFYDAGDLCEPDDITTVMVYLHCLCVISNNKVLTPSKLLNKVVSILTSWTLAYDSRDIKTWTYKSTGVIPDKDHALRIYEKVHASQEDYERTVLKSPYFVQLTRVIPIEDPKQVPPEHIQWLQEIITLGWAALQIIPYPALAQAFISRHRAYLCKHQYLIPESWWLDDDMINSLLFPPNKEPKSKTTRTLSERPGITAGNNPPKIEVPSNTAEVNPVVIDFDPPKVSQQQMSYLRNSCKFKPTASSFVTNFPSHAVLWIGIAPLDAPDDHIQWTKYQQYDRVILAKPKESTQYIFAFGLATDDSWVPPIDTPRTIETIEIKQESPKDPLPTPDGVMNWIQKSTEQIMATPPELPQAPANNPADDLAIDLLVQLDEINPTYEISSDDRGMTLTFRWESGIRVRYELKTGNIILSGWDKSMYTDILRDIWDDLKSIFEREIKQKESLKRSSILGTLTWIESYLDEAIRYILDIKPWEDILNNTRLRRWTDFYGVRFFDKNHTKHWNALVETCKNLWIDIKMEEHKGISGTKNEAKMTVSIIEYKNIIWTIHSRSTAPYYEIHASISKIWDDVYRQKLESILKHILLLLGVVGRSIGQDQNIRLPWYLATAREVMATLDTSIPRYRGYEELGTDRQKEIRNAIRALDAWKGKILYKKQILPYSAPHPNWTEKEFWYYDIQSRRIKQPDASWIDLDAGTIIVTHDETVASITDKTWHLRIYDRIRLSPRLKKYLILRLIATIDGRDFRWKAPFSNGTERFLSEFWDQELIKDKKQDFIDAVKGYKCEVNGQDIIYEGKARKGLDIRLSDGSILFDVLLQQMQEWKIQLIYNSPDTRTIAELRYYKRTMPQNELSITANTDGMIIPPCFLPLFP
jgi:hypothetical protein